MPKAPTKTAAGGRAPVLVDLALQGGGSHGAFTWGVLDRLLEETWMTIEAVSGTSAGAMNAAVMAAGYAKGGAPAARKALDAFWAGVSRAARFSPFQRGPIDKMLGRWTLDNSPLYITMDLMARLVSPYTMGVGSENPLEAVLNEHVDFAALADGPIKVYVTATNLRTGRGRVFRNHEITPQALTASSCLPSLFQAVEIDGEAYWDGGYAGNPTMMPLITDCKSDDTILVPLNPVERQGTPRTAREILNRLNEVAFNSVLLKELKMIALLRRVADAGTGEGKHYANMRIHMVRNPMAAELGSSSKMNAEWDFLAMLREEGRKQAGLFLDAYGADIGKRSTLDIDQLLEGM
jgi:NTE family protein